MFDVKIKGGEFMLKDMAMFWMVAMWVFVIVEVISPNLVSLWFAVGSVAALIAANYSFKIQWQMVIFLIVSLILLSLLRPIYIKYIKVKNIKTNVDALIGEEGFVTADINNVESKGLVKVKGQIWSARAQDEEIILSGTKIKILKIEGVKLIVKTV